jgi:hypothetical protein
MGPENLDSSGVRTPNHPAGSDSLYRCYPSHIKKMYKIQFHKEGCVYHESQISLIYVNKKSIRLSVWHRPSRCLLSLRAYLAVAVKISKLINIITRRKAATSSLKRWSNIPYAQILLKVQNVSKLTSKIGRISGCVENVAIQPPIKGKKSRSDDKPRVFSVTILHL